MCKENVINLVGKRLLDVIFIYLFFVMLLGNRIFWSCGFLYSCIGVFLCLFISVKFVLCFISNLVMVNVGLFGGSCKDNNMYEKFVKMKYIVGL